MKEHDIFLAAVEIADPDAREAYLADACAGDSSLRREVESLLAAEAQSGEFLDVPVLQQMGGEPALRALGETRIDSNPRTDEIELPFLEPPTRPGWLGRLAHYEIEEILGQGAFGIVAKAFDEKLHRVVAIKLMSPDLATTSPPRKRFLREARAAAAVTHENIVAIHAVEEEPIPYLVMEYISGKTLQQRMDEYGPLEIPEVLRIGRQVAAGLAAAHAVNLIHRDIKPSNILLSDGPHSKAKISDFGLARAVDDAALTSSGLIAGTPLYMSPEQARGETLDHRSDLFSLGSVLYQMVGGRPPFRAANTVAVLLRVCEDTPRPLNDVLPGTPGWLEAIIGRLLEKDRDDRFQTAREVADLLACCQTELEQSGHVTCVEGATGPTKTPLVSPVHSPDAEAKRKLFAWLIGGVIGTATLIGLLLQNWNRPTPEAGVGSASGNRMANTEIEPPANPAGTTTWHDWPADAPPPAIAPFDAAQARAHQEAWAKYLDTDVEVTNSLGAKMVVIPPGEFLMGSTDEQVAEATSLATGSIGFQGHNTWIEGAERPQHRVVLTRPFLMSATEVTIGQFQQFAKASGYRTRQEQKNASRPEPDAEQPSDTAKLPEFYRNPGHEVNDNFPAEFLSWDDATAFCQWLSAQEGCVYRLPTEAEWEYACRAGTTTQFSFGDDPKQLDDYGWHRGNSAVPQQVATKRPNAFGLFDMHGNVYEFCSDFFDSKWYERTPTNNPAGPDVAAQHTIRGGWSRFAINSRSAYRSPLGANWVYQFGGFRYVKEIDLTESQTERIPEPKTPVDKAAKSSMDDEGETIRQALHRQNPDFKGTISVLVEDGRVFRCSVVNGELTDLSPLLSLKHVRELNYAAFKPERDGAVVRELLSLESINGDSAAAYRLAFPANKPPSGVSDEWLTAVAGLPVKERVRVVVEKMQEQNPNFDGEYRFQEADMSLRFSSRAVTDLSPLKALPELRGLACSVSLPDRSWLSDLSPLRDIPLTSLECWHTQISDLAPLRGKPLTTLIIGGTSVSNLEPLKGMPLTILNISGTPVEDLRQLSGLKLQTLSVESTKIKDLLPLAGMPLVRLYCDRTSISDLSPLQGAPLRHLSCWNTQVSDLSPLRGMPLKELWCFGTTISDLSPLAGMELTVLSCRETKVADLSPLAGMPLESLWIPAVSPENLDVVRGIPSLKQINAKPAAEFWQATEER